MIAVLLGEQTVPVEKALVNRTPSSASLSMTRVLAF